MSEDQVEPLKAGFEQLYPDLSMWLRYGGRLQMRPATETAVEVWLGDPGGYLSDGNLRGSVNEVFDAAELKAAKWRIETRRLQQELARDPEFRHESSIRVTGWPPLANPNYDPMALQQSQMKSDSSEDV